MEKSLLARYRPAALGSRLPHRRSQYNLYLLDLVQQIQLPVEVYSGFKRCADGMLVPCRGENLAQPVQRGGVTHSADGWPICAWHDFQERV